MQGEFLADKADCWILCLALQKRGTGALRMYHSEQFDEFDETKSFPQEIAEMLLSRVEDLRGDEMRKTNKFLKTQNRQLEEQLAETSAAAAERLSELEEKEAELKVARAEMAALRAQLAKISKP